ncbi:MoCF-biosynth domain-containing protein [Sulfidibacter corallicola]|uniref:MoaB/Mog domain-containing protein n=1 Tax=Sulfidibacter corallicola TaxID=2818388 RepID=A0A8A4TX29_SULCO|nr:molybdopterin-binding protein [Sulfidibacter corallicola]QTD53761.1 hypothetical protein J3U87_15025 [Sulfidibacter corallicola]
MISILIIGNEILSAQIEETNLKHMLRELAIAGYAVDEVRMVRDDREVIAAAIRELSRNSRYVISSGGVGPTHDDVTLEAYGEAFGSELYLHPDLEAGIRKYYGDRITAAALRLARVPRNTELVYAGSSKWPIIKVENCFVLPGLPEIFVKKLEGVIQVLPSVPRRYYAELLTSAEEGVFAGELHAFQAQFPQIEIGSYPRFDQSHHAAKVTLKGNDVEALDRLFNLLTKYFTRSQSLVASSAPEPYRPNN